MEKKYYKRLVVGSVLFGIIVFGNEVYNNGLWNLSGFFWIAYGAIGFGVLYHILFSCFIKKDDSDKKLKEKWIWEKYGPMSRFSTS